MNLVYINSANGLSKAALETVTYAKKLGADVAVVTNGNATAIGLVPVGTGFVACICPTRRLQGVACTPQWPFGGRGVFRDIYLG